ncbi:MAG: Hsp20/alpha crystallin family protein [Betaproteobacteria bacterium]
MARVQVYDPFAGSGIDELFRGIFAPVRRDADAPAPIRIDVTEDDAGYVVHAEIPGVKKEDIHVTIEGNQVTIAAEVKRESGKKDGERVLRSERYAGSVHRSFVLPVQLDETSSEARVEGGVLELKLAKKPAIAGRKLTIQ